MDQPVTRPPGSAEWQALLGLTGPAATPPPQTLDWDWLLDLAQRHKVVLLLQRALAGTELLPPAAAQRLQSMARDHATRALHQTRQLVLLSQSLQQAGITASVLKGVPLSQQLHGQPALRDAGDIDLLVPPQQVPAAAQLLFAQGFTAEFGSLLASPRQRRRAMASTNQMAFIHTGRRVQLELHWRLQKIEGMMPTDPARIWNAAQVSLAGQAIAVPDPVEHAIYLCAHGAGHGWHRLKWLNDLRWLLHAPDMLEHDWQGVATRARQIKMPSAVAAAALLVQRIDGTPLPAPLQDLIKETPRAQALSHFAESWMSESACLRHDPPPQRHPLKLARSMTRRLRISSIDQPGSLWAQLRFLLGPSLADLAAADLPRGLGAGYLVVRLLHLLQRMRRTASTTPQNNA